MNSKLLYESKRKEVLDVINDDSLTLSEKFDKLSIQELIQDTDIYQAELLAQNQELLDKEQEILNSRLEFEKLYNLAPLAYFRLDHEYNIIQFNNFAFKMFFDFNLNLLRHKPFSFLVDSNNILDFIDIQKFVESNDYASGVLSFKEKTKLIGRIDIAKHNDEYFVSIIDITKEKKQEALMLVQAKKAAMGEMLSMITHQWKQPLSVVSTINSYFGYALDADEFDKEKFVASIQEMRDQIEYMTQTVDDFKDYFKDDKHKVLCNINNCIDKAIKFTKPSLKKYDIKLTLEYLDDKKNEINSFRNDICQVLMNIINNAKDELMHLPEEVERKIEVKVFHKEDFLILTIKNNGGVISKDIIGKIFNYNFTTKDSLDGSGIGLFIVEKIVTEHLGGEIEVVNIPDENSVQFTIKIPLID